MSKTRFLLLLFSLANLLLCHLGQAVVHITFDYSQLVEITGKVKWNFKAQLVKLDEKTGILMRSEKEETHSVLLGAKYEHTASFSVPDLWLARGWPVLMAVEIGAPNETPAKIEFAYKMGGQRVEIRMMKDAMDKPMYGLKIDKSQEQNTIQSASGNKRGSKGKEAESFKRPKTSVSIPSSRHHSINAWPNILNFDQTNIGIHTNPQMSNQQNFDALSTPYQINFISGSNVRPMNRPFIGTNSNVYRPDHAGSDHIRIIDNRVPPYQQNSLMQMQLRNDHGTGQNVQQMSRNQNVGNDLNSMGQGLNHGLAHRTDSNMASQSQQHYRISSNMPFFWNPHGLDTNMASLSGTTGTNTVLDRHNLNNHSAWDQFVNHVTQSAYQGNAVQRAQMQAQPVVNAASQPVAIFDSSRRGGSSGKAIQNERQEMHEAWPASSASGSGLTVSSSAAAHQQRETSKLAEEHKEEDDDDHVLIQNLLKEEEQGNFDDIFSSSKKQA